MSQDTDEIREVVADAIKAVRWPDGEPYVHMASVHIDRIAAFVVAALQEKSWLP